ncbi:hypothetical protein F511_37011 [Dorcoceras hygrometricum]|uniref:Uncharacterized protein n=1 Tax=Dorcoceras hygrometricum TaxID=472368 RepID=A0A2Z7A0G9_9LAMI|nr:hypothetical protein F511_37011 [Dorcoceras hygrometricum]
MKIFGLLRSKGGHHQPNQDSRTNDHMMRTQPCREEFNDWPDALLAIGTFGNNNLKGSDNINIQGSLSVHTSPDHPPEHIRPEDSAETDKELRRILNQHISTDSSFSGELEKHYVSLERYLENLLKADNVINKSRNSAQKRKFLASIKPRAQIMTGKETILGGSVLTPGLRYPIAGPGLANSRMDKILRAILNTRVCPHRSSPKAEPNEMPGYA